MGRSDSGVVKHAIIVEAGYLLSEWPIVVVIIDLMPIDDCRRGGMLLRLERKMLWRR